MSEFALIIAALGIASLGFYAYGALSPQAQAAPGAPDSEDVDTLARTIWGEARGEGYAGMVAVANVVINRYMQAQASNAKAVQFGRTISQICKKPFQFSAWLISDPNYYKMLAVTEEDPAFSAALQIARQAVSLELVDITEGANHYHTSSVNPSWSRGKEPVSIIGVHQFYDLA